MSAHRGHRPAVDGLDRARVMTARDDDVRFAEISVELADALIRILPGWVAGCVERRWPGPVPADVLAEAAAVGERAALEVGTELRHELALDVDDQTRNPLAIVRAAVSYPNTVLTSHDIPHTDRDEFSRRVHPEDIYDLAPAAFGDIDPELTDIGIVWGAAKAHLHLQRRSAEGRR